MNRFHALLAACLLAQAGFWWQTHSVRPPMDIVPPVPGEVSVQAEAFGDTQFYFRALTLEMQNFGDLFGRFTALKDYDFPRLARWFHLLDTLDARADAVPNMASYYFGQTQNMTDTRHVVDYLYAHGSRDPARKWWWLLQGVYISMHKLNNLDLAAKVAQPMLSPGVPVWAQQMVAVVQEKRGELDAAYDIMQTIQQNAESLSDSDLRYMAYFVRERLHRVENIAPR